MKRRLLAAARAMLLVAAATAIPACGKSKGGNPSSEPVPPGGPVAAKVYDGLGADATYQYSTKTISANWDDFSDPTGITGYEWAVGTEPGGTDVQPFTAVGLATTAINSSLTLTTGTTYYASVRATSGEGLQTTESSDGVTVDTSAPAAGTVNDGIGLDEATQGSSTTISANWSGFGDAESGVLGYEWAVGTTPGGTNVQPFTSVGLDTVASNFYLSLSNHGTYYVTVRATHGAGLQTVASSNGVTVRTPFTIGGWVGGGPPAPPLAGTYTVGTGKSYSTPAVAHADLMSHGQSAPVIFDVYEGDYPGTLSVESVAGNSAANTITFRKAAAASGPVNLGPVRIAGASYVTLTDFDSITASRSAAVFITGGSTNITLARNRIRASGEGGVGIYIDGEGHSGISVSRCEIVGAADAWYGIQLEDRAAVSGGTAGLSLTNNMIRGFILAGIRLWSDTGGIAGTARHNSIWIRRLAPQSHAVIQRGSTVAWRNNIFANYGGFELSYCFGHMDVPSKLDSNYNDFWRPGGAATGISGGSVYATLADWQSGVGQDAGGIQADPQFVADDDLHLQAGSSCIDAGTDLGVAEDYDGDGRPGGSAPDIGADETP